MIGIFKSKIVLAKKYECVIYFAIWLLWRILFLFGLKYTFLTEALFWVTKLATVFRQGVFWAGESSTQANSSHEESYSEHPVVSGVLLVCGWGGG